MLSPIMSRLNNTAITIEDFYGTTNLFNNDKVASPLSHVKFAPIQTFSQMRQSPPKLGLSDMLYL